MFEKLGEYIFFNLSKTVSWSNVYGLSRSLMAFSLMLTLLINDVQLLFKPVSGVPTYPGCQSYSSISIFCITPNGYFYLNLIKGICILGLFLVVIGWRPRITGLLHWWIAYSVQVSAVSLDGGEQVNAVFALLLLPIALTDKRKWHWQLNEQRDFSEVQNTYISVIPFITYKVIRLQVAIIYFNAPIAKLKREEWLNGTAIYYFFNDTMLGIPDFIMGMTRPLLQSWLVVIPTWGTLVAQLLLFLGLFSPKKYWKYLLWLGIFLHGSIAVFLGLYSFSLIMIAVLILYLRPFEKEFHFNLIINKIKQFKSKVVFSQRDI